MAAVDLRQALGPEEPERDVQPREERHGRGELPLVLRLPAALGGQVPVEPGAASPARPLARRGRSRATNARPGGHISPFCEPATTASIPQASIGHGTTPSDETVSTTHKVSVRRVSAA